MSVSARLVLDSFSRWRESLGALSLDGRRGFTTLAFDQPGSNGLGGTPPRFAAWAEGREGIVAIESQHGNHLTPKPAGAAASFFESVQDKRSSSPLLGDMKRLARAADYVQLDAVARVKAYTGLARAGREATLLYLYWEPLQSTPESLRHRTEVAAFGKAADLPGARFAAQSYPELWASWEKQAEPDWLAGHAATLRLQYEKA